MIEGDNLRTASLYINNQLLSRGLLKDGQNIDFASPGTSDGDVATTMGRIMSIVNDLILRRDRDAEHREALSTTLRTLRAESLRQTSGLQRLQDKHAEAQRRVGLSEAAEAAIRAQLKATEAHVHKLKEEAARTKTLVAQTRAACANEVRKRDRQIESLKKAVADAGRARGAGRNPAVTTITVTGEMVPAEEEQGTPRGGTSADGYDLRMETNAFLAELAKGLSEENETLHGLFRDMCERLREMSGWQKDEASAAAKGDGHALALPINVTELASETDALLDHLKTILTNPSFVPIEEVVVREDEINRLRDGWEKMEIRWKEAVHLIDGWRRRMATSGRPVNIEELKMGLRLSPVRVKDVAETSQGLDLRLSAVEEAEEEPSAVHSPSPADSLHLVPAPEFEDPDGSDSESSIFEDEVDMDDLEVEEPNVQILQHSMMLDSSPLPLPPQLSPLRDSYSAANRGTSGDGKARKRAGDITTIVEENTRDVIAEAPPQPPLHSVKVQAAREKHMKVVKPRQEEDIHTTSADLSASVDSLESVLLLKSPEKVVPSTLSKAPEPTNTSRRQGEDAKSATKHSSQPPPPRSSGQRSKQQTRPDETEKSTNSTTASTGQTRSTTTTTTSTSTAPSPAKTDAEMMPPPPGRSPRRPAANSRLPLPRTNNAAALPPPPQSPLTMATIAAKLAASEREADAARVRAKLRAARLTKRVSLAPPAPTGEEVTQTRSTRSDGEVPTPGGGDPVKKDTGATVLATGSGGAQPTTGASKNLAKDSEVDELQLPMPISTVKPRKRERERHTSKSASRRRSTLNPWELETLIQGSVNMPSPVR